MKSILLLYLLGWVTAPTVAVDLETVRQNYRKAPESEQAAKALHDDLTSVGMDDGAVLVAYKGAIATIMAEYAEGFKDKKTFFKDGRELLEHAVEQEPDNVEIRCIRLSVQENVPKITGYHKDREADKQFILERFATMADDSAKAFVKGFAQQSESFTETEKAIFQG